MSDIDEVPVLRWEQDHQEQILAENFRSHPTNWAEASRMLGRNMLPWALDAAVSSRNITDLDEIALALEDAWTGAEFPMQYLRRADWLGYFTMVGYLENDRRAERPREPFTVFRGSLCSTRRRWSWTDDLERAEWFADRIGLDGHVWTAVVKPESLLAHFVASRNEAEYVINTQGIKILEHTHE